MKPWVLVSLFFAGWYGAEAAMQAIDRWLSPEAVACSSAQPFVGAAARCTRMVAR
jgi:hypothetical protein